MGIGCCLRFGLNTSHTNEPNIVPEKKVKATISQPFIPRCSASWYTKASIKTNNSKYKPTTVNNIILGKNSISVSLNCTKPPESKATTTFIKQVMLL